MNSTNGENGHVEHGIEYDYIVCGGGTSGLVIAARLAEDYHVEVLLIEAGKDSKDLENVHMVGGYAQVEFCQLLACFQYSHEAYNQMVQELRHRG